MLGVLGFVAGNWGHGSCSGVLSWMFVGFRSGYLQGSVLVLLKGVLGVLSKGSWVWREGGGPGLSWGLGGYPEVASQAAPQNVGDDHV